MHLINKIKIKSRLMNHNDELSPPFLSFVHSTFLSFVPIYHACDSSSFASSSSPSYCSFIIQHCFKMVEIDRTCCVVKRCPFNIMIDITRVVHASSGGYRCLLLLKNHTSSTDASSWYHQTKKPAVRLLIIHIHQKIIRHFRYSIFAT